MVRTIDSWRAKRLGQAMTYRDETDMGGVGQAFLTTHWSLIEEIQSDEGRDSALIGLLLERYWKPVYYYLRRKGHENEDAKDLTQGFFHEVVLNRNLIQRANQTKGRFRTFLLHALEHYLIDEQHRREAKKRIPKEKLVPLDLTVTPSLPEAVCQSDPQDSYNYGWMAALLDQVLSAVESECSERGMAVHWKVFFDRVVHPILENAEPPSLAEICRKYDIADRKKASNMVITVKRCFRQTLEEHVGNTVMSEADAADELAEIMQFFGNSAQHF
jgi:RNA polymerase sigma-70 factor (ECF subfamily)